MKKLVITLCASAALGCVAFGGTSTYSSGKEMQQTQAAAVAPCPEWYRTNEFNLSLWGTYAFTGENWQNDRYLGVDHAWGGGIDAKYFFARYFGVGVEGDILRLSQNNGTFVKINGNENSHGLAGTALGTFTFRYPIPCSRFAPYAFVGGGGIFGGGGTAFVNVNNTTARNNSSESKLLGQFGGGLEIRFTPRLGMINDFSWNVIDGSSNNFGMVRSGLTFAF